MSESINEGSNPVEEAYLRLIGFSSIDILKLKAQTLTTELQLNLYRDATRRKAQALLAELEEHESPESDQIRKAVKNAFDAWEKRSEVDSTS